MKLLLNEWPKGKRGSEGERGWEHERKGEGSRSVVFRVPADLYFLSYSLNISLHNSSYFSRGHNTIGKVYYKISCFLIPIRQPWSPPTATESFTSSADEASKQLTTLRKTSQPASRFSPEINILHFPPNGRTKCHQIRRKGTRTAAANWSVAFGQMLETNDREHLSKIWPLKWYSVLRWPPTPPGLPDAWMNTKN